MLRALRPSRTNPLHNAAGITTRHATLAAGTNYRVGRTQATEGVFLIDHISLGTCRYSEAVAFYRQALAPIDAQLMRDSGNEAAFGTGSRWFFFLYPQDAAQRVTAPGTHLAFSAATRAQVIAVYEAALAASGTNLFSPRERPDISPTYFGAMFTDLDGHRVEVLTNDG